MPGLKHQWTADEYAVLDANYGRMKLRSVAALLPGRTVAAIRTRAQMRGLRADRSVTNKQLPGWDEGYFSQPNEENSYWAGLLAADGSINRTAVALYQADEAVVRLFKDTVAYPGALTCRHRSRVPTTEYSVSMTSPRMVADLAKNYNIVPAKSLTLLAPKQLSRDCALSFLVGLIDGDGSICVKSSKNGSRYLSVTCTCTESVANWMKEVLGHGNVHRRMDCQSGIWRYQASHTSGIRVAEQLWRHEPTKCLRFSRKWDKVDQFIAD